MKRMMRNSGSRIPHDPDGTVAAYVGRVRNDPAFSLHVSVANRLLVGAPLCKVGR
jgi:hypothetical protein